ncbi:hypothetical protein RRG08_028670 [Elysia crispata]|uniref:Uncharacterized protein n=1 Tax=Elysia crispata TaxID=231223 RepID=A0AAE0ZBX3_9GAST|nr:hypothetical protein RRG08_028670 [Elysia crispata]
MQSTWGSKKERSSRGLPQHGANTQVNDWAVTGSWCRCLLDSAELAKLPESLREDKLHLEDLLPQLDTFSTDDIFAGIDKAIDLNKAWAIDRVAYNAIHANNSLYNDQIEDVNRFYNDAKSGYRVILKDLDDDDLKQEVKNELNDRILEIDRMKTMMGFSD